MAAHIQHIKSFIFAGVTVNGAGTENDGVSVTERRRSSVTIKTVWAIAGIIIALLALRFVFMLLGTNQNHMFVDIIYTLSTPFTTPFFAIFSYTPKYDVSTFEYSTLAAIIGYALAAWGIARLSSFRRA